MGRLKRDKTTIINFRVTESEKAMLKKHYPNLSKLFKDFIKQLLK